MSIGLIHLEEARKRAEFAIGNAIAEIASNNISKYNGDMIASLNGATEDMTWMLVNLMDKYLKDGFRDSFKKMK